MPSSTLFHHAEAVASVTNDYASLCELVAGRIALLIQAKPDVVLGLATGSAPLGVYDLLARRHQSGGLDFSGVTCFNLDEYYPMSADSVFSYHHFMQEHLFGRINCRRWFVPDGRPASEEEIALACRDYEARISAAGGIDLHLLGIGRSGHIGFNEPGSAPGSRTRLVTLHPLTLEDAADSFGGLGNVPRQAVTMGLGTILEAREIVMMASGAAKAGVVRSAWIGAPLLRLWNAFVSPPLFARTLPARRKNLPARVLLRVSLSLSPPLSPASSSHSVCCFSCLARLSARLDPVYQKGDGGVPAQLSRSYGLPTTEQIVPSLVRG